MLLQRLPEPGDVAVPEDAEAAREEPLRAAVALDLLGGEEADERLGDGEPSRDQRPRARPCVGIASAQASREATSAPAALASAIVSRRPSPASSPCTSAPPNASPAPSPLTTSMRDRRDLDEPSAVRASRPGAALDDRHAHAELEQRVGRRLGSRVPVGDLDLVAVADGDGRVAERLARPAARLGARTRTSAGGRGRGR